MHNFVGSRQALTTPFSAIFEVKMWFKSEKLAFSDTIIFAFQEVRFVRLP